MILHFVSIYEYDRTLKLINILIVICISTLLSPRITLCQHLALVHLRYLNILRVNFDILIRWTMITHLFGASRIIRILVFPDSDEAWETKRYPAFIDYSVCGGVYWTET